MRKIATSLAVLAVVASAWSASAAPLNVVALGASNTSGSGQGRHPGGVARDQAYPAQLEALLRARGIDAHVRNAGVSGDTTAAMLKRVDAAVPNDTQIVILQPGANDRRHGLGDASANVAAMTSRLAARGIKVVLLDKLDAPASTRDPDGQHFNAQGHAAIAATLLPLVIAAAVK